MGFQRHEPKSFPVATFVQQYNAACRGGIQDRHVRVNSLRSKKHATVEVSIPSCTEGIEDPTRTAVIVKYFEDADTKHMLHERDVLLYAASECVSVPKVLHVLDNFLVLEKVEGSTLMDVINDGALPLEHKKEAIASLGSWLLSFHSAFASHPKVRRRGDANLRNFIVTGGGAIVGLDFEEAGLEDPMVDLHEVVDSILQSSPGIYSDGMPAIGWKFGLCGGLLRSYAAAARKPFIDTIKDPAGFVDAQIRVMRELADIRGKAGLLAPLIPAIRKELGIAVESLGHRKRSNL